MLCYRVFLASIILSTGFLQAGEYNPVLNIGDAAPAWSKLPGVDGKEHSLADLKGKQLVIVVFTCNSCPAATLYEDRLIALAKKHAGPDSKAGVVAINVNRVEEDLLPAMQERAKAKKFPFAYLFDESQKIGRDYGANYTPEFFVLDENRKVVYMGSFDDNLDPSKVKVNYVEEAIAAALSGTKPTTKETVAKGCRVRYARERK
jgi:peroxiredoxin